MLELNNYYIQKVENLTDLFTIIFTIVDDIYNDIIPISIRNRRNIKDSKLCDSEIIISHKELSKIRKITIKKDLRKKKIT